MSLIVVLGIECSLIHAQLVITPRHHKAFYKVSVSWNGTLSLGPEEKNGQVWGLGLGGGWSLRTLEIRLVTHQHYILFFISV